MITTVDDWFYGNHQVVQGAENILNELGIPVFTAFRHDYEIDLNKFTIIESLSSSSTPSSSTTPVVYKALYNGQIIFAEIWNPVTIQDQINIMLNLSIQCALPSDQFVQILGAGYFQFASSFKILILKECIEDRWNKYISRETLTWSIRLQLALDLTNALYDLHSHHLTLRAFIVDSIFIHADGRIRLDGLFQVNKLPFQKVDTSRRRQSLVASNSYHSNIKQYGDLLQMLIQDKATNCILDGCPEEFQALIEWCTDDEPMVAPTMADCLSAIEKICKQSVPPVVLSSPSSQRPVLKTNRNINQQPLLLSQDNPFDEFTITPRKEENAIHASNHQNTATKKSALKHLNDKISNNHGMDIFVDTYTTAAADTLTSTSFQPTWDHAAAVDNHLAVVPPTLDKRTYAIDLLSQTSAKLAEIDKTLSEYIENMKNPFSDLCLQLEDMPALLETNRVKQEHADNDDLDTSIEGFEYLELMSALHDRLGHIKSSIHEVSKISFPPEAHDFIQRSMHSPLIQSSSAEEFGFRLEGNEEEEHLRNRILSADEDGNVGDDSMDLQFQVVSRPDGRAFDRTDQRKRGQQVVDSDDEMENHNMVETISIGIQTEHIDMTTSSIQVPEERLLTEEMEVQTEEKVAGVEAEIQTEIEDMASVRPNLVSRLPVNRTTSIDSACSHHTSSSSRRPVVPRLELAPELTMSMDRGFEVINASASFSDDDSEDGGFDFIGEKAQTDPMATSEQSRSVVLESSVERSVADEDAMMPSNNSARPLSKVKETAMAYELKAKNKGSSPREGAPMKPLTPRGQPSLVASTVAAIESSKNAPDVDFPGHGIALEGLSNMKRVSGSAQSSPMARRKSNNDLGPEGTTGLAVEEQKQSLSSNETMDDASNPLQLDQPSISAKPEKPIDEKTFVQPPPQSMENYAPPAVPAMPPLQLKTSNSFILKNFNKPILERTSRPVSVEELIIGDKMNEDSWSRTLVMPSSPTPPELRRGNSQSDLSTSRSSPSSMPPAHAKSSPTWSGNAPQVNDRVSMTVRSTPSPTLMLPSSSSAKTVLRDSASQFLENIRKLDSFYTANDGIQPPSSSESSPPPIEQPSFCSPPMTGSSMRHNRTMAASSSGRELTPSQFNYPHRYSSPPSALQHSYSPLGHSPPQADPNAGNLNVALSSFLQIVQRCSATSNRAKELIDNMDKKILTTSATSPKRSPGTNPNMYHSFSGSSVDWQRTNALSKSTSHEERARTYSPTTNRTLTSSHFTGRTYSSPERTRIAEESRRKAALQAVQSKSTINMDHKLSHERNTIAYSISPKSSAKLSSSGRLDWKQHL